MNSLHAAASRTVGEEIGMQLSVIPALHSNATILMDPLVARQLKEIDGFETNEAFSRWVSENALIPAGRYWGTDTVDMLVTPLANAGVEPYASWKRRRMTSSYPITTSRKGQYRRGGGRDQPAVEDQRLRLHGVGVGGLLAASEVEGECADGACGLPDQAADYDD